MSRRARREEYTCDICGIRVKLWPNQLRNGRATCGKTCPGLKIVRPCNYCTLPTPVGRFCSIQCREMYVEPKVPYKHCSAKRQSVYNRGESIDRLEVFDAHDWKCWLCGHQVNPDLRLPHPFAATLDHAVPLSRGGEHIWTNVRCAHKICNENKGNTLPEEFFVLQ